MALSLSAILRLLRHIAKKYSEFEDVTFAGKVKFSGENLRKRADGGLEASQGYESDSYNSPWVPTDKVAKEANFAKAIKIISSEDRQMFKRIIDAAKIQSPRVTDVIKRVSEEIVDNIRFDLRDRATALRQVTGNEAPCDELLIDNFLVPWNPRTKIGPSFSLYKYQIGGIAWALYMMGTNLRAGILGNTIGLGKRYQALVLHAIMKARLHIWQQDLSEGLDNADGADKKPAWTNKPTIVLCPKSAVHEWVKSAKFLLPTANVIDYNSGKFKLKTRDEFEALDMNSIVIMTAKILRHGKNARNKWVNAQMQTREDFIDANRGGSKFRRAGTPTGFLFKGRRTSAHFKTEFPYLLGSTNPCPTAVHREPFPTWPWDINGVFGLGLLDEAHLLKDPTTVSWRNVLEIDLGFRLLITGTPISNNVKDLGGVLGILGPSIWDNFGIDANNTYPLDYDEADEELLLICSQRGAEIVELEKSAQKQAELINMTYSQCMLKRTYSSEYDGEKIMKDMPPHKKITIPLQIQEKHAERLKSIMTKNMMGLFKFSSGTSGVIMDAKSLGFCVKLRRSSVSMILQKMQRNVRTLGKADQYLRRMGAGFAERTPSEV